MREKTLTIEELAEYFSVTKRTLEKMIASEEFPVKPVKGLRPRRWSLELVNAWMDGKNGK